MGNYKKFLAMIIVSIIIMFCLMYLNTFAFNHVRWSETRAYMAVIMGTAMAVTMLLFMRDMYPNPKTNKIIILASIGLFIAALLLVRSQTTVGDISYMNAMIPHHSIAIMTSERAKIKDVRVRKLADGIAATQIKEIAEMKWLIDDIQKNGLAETEEEALTRPVPKMASSE